MYMSNGGSGACLCTPERGLAAALLRAGRRAPRAPGRRRQQAGLRAALRALLPAAVSLLPVDRPRRPRRAGRPPIDVRERVRRTAKGPARRAAAPVAVPDRAQRGRFGHPAAPPGEGSVGGIGPLLRLRRGAGRRPGALCDADARPRGVARASALGARDARAQRPLARGDRARARTSVGAAKQTIFEARRSLSEFAEGRVMACDEVRKVVSDADGRSLRSRRVRAHLSDCAGCAESRRRSRHAAPTYVRSPRRCRRPRQLPCSHVRWAPGRATAAAARPDSPPARRGRPLAPRSPPRRWPVW